MPKFFVSSDIHSAFTPWMKALNEAGFDENNPEHMIVVCGDLFDRMDESLQVYDFVKDMLDRDKLIYVKGNHESLMEDCLSRGFPYSYDRSNGTEKSIIDLAPDAENFYDACSVVYEKMKPLFDKMVNYFETKNKYIFVHGWIPLICGDNLPMHYARNRKFEYNPEWRNAHYSEWEQARWANGMDAARKGFIEPGRTIICGHWHCSYGHMMDDMAKNGPFDCIDEFGESAIWEPYYGNGIIAIDKCVAHTGELHCIVLEDEFLEE
jgi:serine/threonine protein phosphatase 1